MPFADGLHLTRGTTTFHELPVGRSALGSEFSMPLVIINGKDPGPTMAITAGVHGSEYTGIVACTRLIKEIDPSRLKGRVVMVPLVNPRSFEMRTSMNPLDLGDIGNVFPGQRFGTLSEQIAYVIHHEIVLGADAYFDLHGGGLFSEVPLYVSCQRTGRRDLDERSEALARLFPGELLLVMGKGLEELSADFDAQGMGFIAIPNRLTAAGAAGLGGVPAVMIEAGGGGRLDPALVDFEVEGLTRALRFLGMLPGPAPEAVGPRRCYGLYRLRSRYGGLFFPAVELGQVVETGELIGEMRDLRGEVIASFHAPMNMIVMMLYTTPARNPGEHLLTFALVEESDVPPQGGG